MLPSQPGKWRRLRRLGVTWSTRHGTPAWFQSRWEQRPGPPLIPHEPEPWCEALKTWVFDVVKQFVHNHCSKQRLGSIFTILASLGGKALPGASESAVPKGIQRDARQAEPPVGALPRGPWRSSSGACQGLGERDLPLQQRRIPLNPQVGGWRVSCGPGPLCEPGPPWCKPLLGQVKTPRPRQSPGLQWPELFFRLPSAPCRGGACSSSCTISSFLFPSTPISLLSFLL